MPTELKLPELGENIAAGDVVRVLVKPGDTIVKDQPVIELETDKATIEVPSSIAGVVKEVQVKPGQKVKVGQTVLTVEGDGGAAAKPAAAEPKAAEAEPAEVKPSAAKAAEPETKESEEEPAEERVPETPRAKRGEVVDISRVSRSASQPAAVESSASAGSAPP